MKDYNKKYIKTIRLNSFRPLCMTEIGMRAIQKYGHPPFIDASCRREPDFENPCPSISALCRQESFAPQLFPNDIVVYITVKGNWLTDYPHWRLIAILEVIDKRPTHAAAASWYKSRDMKIPSNCMVSYNPPYPYDETAGNYEKKTDIKSFLKKPEDVQLKIGARRVTLWDDEYLEKSKKWGDFVITKPIFVELNDPPILMDADMTNIFGKKPNTRNPNKISKEELKKLAVHAGINIVYD